MKLEPFSGPGSTPARKRFWNEARAAVLSATKLAGRHVSVDEHQGKGTVINVADTSARRAIPPAPPCACPSGGITVTLSGITLCGCEPVGGGSVNVTDININGSFGAAVAVAGEWQGTGGLVTLHQYFSTTDCTGTPADITQNVNIVADCNLAPFLNVWNVSVYLDTGLGVRIIFFNGSTSNLCSGAVINNTLSCGATVGGDIAVATGGTAMITY